jgi:hypothetical protein
VTGIVVKVYFLAQVSVHEVAVWDLQLQSCTLCSIADGARLLMTGEADVMVVVRVVHAIV